MNSKEKMATANIFPLLLSLAVPAIIATEAMAALSVSIPIITGIAAFIQLVGTGGAPLCAIKLGEKNQDNL